MPLVYPDKAEIIVIDTKFSNPVITCYAMYQWIIWSSYTFNINFMKKMCVLKCFFPYFSVLCFSNHGVQWTVGLTLYMQIFFRMCIIISRSCWFWHLCICTAFFVNIFCIKSCTTYFVPWLYCFTWSKSINVHLSHFRIKAVEMTKTIAADVIPIRTTRTHRQIHNAKIQQLRPHLALVSMW